jgi:hypothetical protein
MLATPQEKSARTIQSAACLIIGDEVLGGKVWPTQLQPWEREVVMF